LSGTASDVSVGRLTAVRQLPSGGGKGSGGSSVPNCGAKLGRWSATSLGATGAARPSGTRGRSDTTAATITTSAIKLVKNPVGLFCDMAGSWSG
jgi:hypothetical protein